MFFVRFNVLIFLILQPVKQYSSKLFDHRITTLLVALATKLAIAGSVSVTANFYNEY